jgi:hypothetical protein
MRRRARSPRTFSPLAARNILQASFHDCGVAKKVIPGNLAGKVVHLLDERVHLGIMNVCIVIGGLVDGLYPRRIGVSEVIGFKLASKRPLCASAALHLCLWKHHSPQPPENGRTGEAEVRRGQYSSGFTSIS